MRTTKELDFGGQWDLITELPTGLGKLTLGGTNKTWNTPGLRRKEQWPHKRPSQTCLWVSRSLWWWRESTVACHRVRGTEYNSPGSHLASWHFEGGHHYYHYPYHSLASGQTIGREHSPTHQQKIRLKIYWAQPRLSEQDQIPPSQSLLSGIFHKLLILICERADRMNIIITEN